MTSHARQQSEKGLNLDDLKKITPPNSAEKKGQNDTNDDDWDTGDPGGGAQLKSNRVGLICSWTLTQLLSNTY